MPRRDLASSRREFLKVSGASVAAAAATHAAARYVHAAGSDVLKVGLIGCGGRGTGAAGNALRADPNTRLVAMADAFPDRLESSLSALKKQDELGKRVEVDADRCFIGLGAHQQLIESDVDVVLLAEPPHFRPRSLKAAIDAGKHVFCEKPVAVDAPGVRSVLETSEKAKEKGLNIVSGLCWRYHDAVREVMDRVHNGAIGDIRAIQVHYNTGPVSNRVRPPEATEMMYQVRNWYYFTWLSGDHNVEQHVHSLDKGLWTMHDKPPVRAWGMGGRQVRTDPKFGQIYDHHAVVYEYDDGTPIYSFTRQMLGCWNETTDILIGTKGRANVLKFTIEGENPWKCDPKEAKKINMYDREHEALFRAIRAGEPINNGTYMAYSTMLGILGRMATYTGQRITWEDAINSTEDLSPSGYEWDSTPPVLPDADGKYPVAMPGVTQFC
ncbi:MAG: Gfo/Idh/MocA family protein [Planctomycetota bacterium]